MTEKDEQNNSDHDSNVELDPVLQLRARIDAKEIEFSRIIKKLEYFDRISDEIIESDDRDQLNRQYSLLKSKPTEALDIIQEIQSMKIDLDEDPTVIDEWTANCKGQLIKYNKSISRLNVAIRDDEIRFRERQRQEEAVYNAKLRAEIRREGEEEEAEEARRIRKEKFALKLEEKRIELADRQKIQTKLPKLEISKFQGTHLDWTRFWSLFESQIDNSEISDEAKFSYLKELVIPKVRMAIEKLPCSSEGYEKAKELLIQRYGEESEVINAHVTQILSLPVIHGTPRAKIHEFYDQLLGHVQALQTMGKLSAVAGNVRLTLDKLDGIRSDLTITDPDWKKWGFVELLEALRLWIECNPLKSDDKDWRQPEKSQPKLFRREKSFSTRSKDQQWKQKLCVCCETSDHKSSDCTKVTTLEERRKILSCKKLCFNCTGRSHRASECKSRVDCQVCHKKHHTSICDKTKDELLKATNENNVIYPVVIVKVEGIKCRAQLDTGAGSSYASSTLLQLIKKKPIRQDYKRIEMMMQSTTRVMDIYNLQITDLDEHFSLNSEVSKVDRQVLLTLANPEYEKVLEKYSHLKGVKMNEEDKKTKLPVHMILGASDYARIKTSPSARIGNDGEPVAEKTKLGWVIMSPGQELNSTAMMLTRSTKEDYMQLCSLDVLGLSDHPEGDQVRVHEEFKEQLVQREDGKYETSLPWKGGGQEMLPTNYELANKRFQNLLKRLEKHPELFATYHQIIQDQLKEGIVETAPQISNKPVRHHL